MPEPNDDPLVEQLKQRNRDALGAFLEQRRPQLLAFIERNIGPALRRKVEADDILQEVAISAHNSLDEIELGDRDPFSWLCQLAERRIIDAHRKHFGAQKRSAAREVGLPASADQSRAQGLIDLLVASLTTASQAFSRDQREIRLMEAVSTLSEESRSALSLRYVEGLSTKDVAERLGKSDGATRVLLSRTIARLQQILSQDEAFQSFLSDHPGPIPE